MLLVKLNKFSLFTHILLASIVTCALMLITHEVSASDNDPLEDIFDIVKI